MAGILSAVIVGTIGSDAIARQVNDRYAVSFSLAVSESYKDKSGNRQEHTMWFRCTYWAKSANIAQYLTKGKQVVVTSSRIEARGYESNGQPQASIEVTANEVNLVGNKPQDTQNAQPVQKAAPKPQANTNVADMGDDLPFE